MKELPDKSATNSKRNSSNVFSLAVTVGFIAFLLAGSLEGGLTDVQGFIAGFLAVIFLFVFAEILAHRQTPAFKQQGYANLPATVTITPTENESGVTIRIYVNSSPAPSREIRNG